MPIALNNNLSTMKVGEYVWCKYTANSGTVGTFSDFATKTNADVVGQEIPVTSTATPNGYFRFIMVEDWNGKKRLVADRNIQHSITWDTLNTSGIASGGGLPLTSISEQPTIENGFYRKLYSVRLLTGGTSSTDKDNEWDKYIVDSNLGGLITAGDNSVWNWNDIYSWTSTSRVQYTDFRIGRGKVSAIGYSPYVTSTNSISASGFRPVLEEFENEFVVFNKTLILHNDEYRKWSEKKIAQTTSTTNIPIMTSNVLPSGEAKSSGVYSNDSRYQAYRAFNGVSVEADNAWVSNSISNSWISYKFPSQVLIGKIDIAPYGQALSSAPKRITIEGSNNGTNYIKITELNNLTGWTSGIYNSFTFFNSQSYNEYRIYVHENNGHTSYISIADIKMYVKTESDIVSSLWQTVSSTLPTVNQFVDNGMDSLAPLLDRKVVKLEQQKMESKAGILPQDSAAKLFGKKLSLKKYIDVKKIEVK